MGPEQKCKHYKPWLSENKRGDGEWGEDVNSATQIIISPSTGLAGIV